MCHDHFLYLHSNSGQTRIGSGDDAVGHLIRMHRPHKSSDYLRGDVLDLAHEICPGRRTIQTAIGVAAPDIAARPSWVRPPGSRVGRGCMAAEGSDEQDASPSAQSGPVLEVSCRGGAQSCTRVASLCGSVSLRLGAAILCSGVTGEPPFEPGTPTWHLHRSACAGPPVVTSRREI